MSLDPGMYRDSLQIFDSPQFWGRLPHCSHRRYLSHCSWINIPGLWARWRSSISSPFLRTTLAAQDSSRERRATKRSWWRRARSRMILQNKGRFYSVVSTAAQAKHFRYKTISRVWGFSLPEFSAWTALYFPSGTAKITPKCVRDIGTLHGKGGTRLLCMGCFFSAFLWSARLMI